MLKKDELFVQIVDAPAVATLDGAAAAKPEPARR